MQKTSLVIVSKDERRLGDTLKSVNGFLGSLISEILVVDASKGALDDIRRSYKDVRWIDYQQPTGVHTTIAHQRNIGVQSAIGEIIVFTDSGCMPEDSWLEKLLAPILVEGEYVTCGPARAVGSSVYSTIQGWGEDDDVYVQKATTINLAFRREAFDAVGGFDENFGAGEDVDFTWRLTDAGYRLRWVPEAVIQHDWGTRSRQLRRAFSYGKGACRLLRKHPQRIRVDVRENPVPLLYAIFLLGLPLTLRWKWYPLIVLWPFWRHRKAELRWFVVIDHLVMGAGALYELVRPNT